MQQGSYQALLGTYQPASTEAKRVWQCHSCKAWSSNTRNQCFGCGVSNDGQQLVREHVTSQPETGSNVRRTQAPPTLPAHAGTQAEEPVRGKNALKKHLQRSIDKLVGAKKQLQRKWGERWRKVCDSSQKKDLCTTRGVGEGDRIQAESSTAGAGGLGRGAAETCCGARGICERGAGNRRRGRRRRRVYARRGPGQGKATLACVWRKLQALGCAMERFSLETPPMLPADSQEEKKTLVNEQESNQVVNFAKETANALQLFSKGAAQTVSGRK